MVLRLINFIQDAPESAEEGDVEIVSGDNDDSDDQSEDREARINTLIIQNTQESTLAPSDKWVVLHFITFFIIKFQLVFRASDASMFVLIKCIRTLLLLLSKVLKVPALTETASLQTAYIICPSCSSLYSMPSCLTATDGVATLSYEKCSHI